MISTFSHARKFSLLFLEEGEQYISELSASVRCFDTQYSQYRKFDCSVHFCSRSLLIEPHEDQKPIYKYLYKFLATPPTYRQQTQYEQQKEFPLLLTVTRLIEVPLTGSPQQYKTHQQTGASTQ